MLRRMSYPFQSKSVSPKVNAMGYQTRQACDWWLAFQCDARSL